MKDDPRFAGQSPVILALMRSLPQPGTEWSIKGREAWINAALTLFELAYKNPANSDQITTRNPPKQGDTVEQ